MVRTTVVRNSINQSTLNSSTEELGNNTSPASQEATRKYTFDALVLDARLRQSLVSVRSLGSRGLRVAALENVKTVPTFSSRWCQRQYHAPSYESDTEPYLTYIQHLLQQSPTRVIITSSNGTIELLRQHRAEIERHARIALAKEDALAIAVNKEQTLAIAQQLGLHIPRGVAISSVNDVSAVLREVGLPAVVKPVESWIWGEQKGVGLVSELVVTPDEAQRAVEKLTASGGTVLFQQFLSGRREAVSFLYARGHVHARFAQWAKRTEPPLGGVSVVRQSIAIPDDVGEQAERLIREIDLEGYSEVEFRRGSDGLPYLMEINPRLSASVEVAVRAGVDFPYLLYRWANGDKVETITNYRTGGWMRYLKGDIMTTLLALRQRGRPGVDAPADAIRDFLQAFLIPMDYDYFMWNDPLPALNATNGFLQYLVRRVQRILAERHL